MRAVEAAYETFALDQAETLAEFLITEAWPFHSGGPETRKAVLERVNNGSYQGESIRTFWIVADDNRVGLVCLFDIGNGSPMFDLRIRRAVRGQGLGTAAVRWLTTYLFTELPDVNRIEATTRDDNQAMRRVLRRCGYVKEAHYRDAWPGLNGAVHDSIGYAVLRRDWTSGSVTSPDWNDEDELDDASPTS